MVESDRLFAPGNQLLIDDIEHLKKGHVRADITRGILDKAAFRLRILLTPDAQFEIHYR